jgi:Putative zinc-finger
MPSDDRERSFENALASHLRATSSSGVPADPCADSEMLAAYHEGSLAPDQIASLKTHVTTCSRCQEILALLQATDEIPVASVDAPRAAVPVGVHVLPARKTTLWRWVAPAGAVAAALLIWVGLQENNLLRLAKQPSSGDLTKTQVAKTQPASPPPLESPSLDATGRSEAASSEATRKSDAAPPDATKKSEAPPDAFSALDATQPSQMDPALRRRQRSFAKEKDSFSAREQGTPGGSFGGVIGGVAGAAAKPVIPPTPAQDQKSQVPGGVTQTVTVEAANPGVPTTDAAPSDVAQAELESKSANDKRAIVSRSTAAAPAIPGAAPAPSPAPSAEPSQLNTESATLGKLPAEQRNVTNLTAQNQTVELRLASGGVGMVNVSAPGGRVSWRIGSAGVIEFSSNAGRTWIVQPSGIVTDLLAGSAPSAKICWIVGRSGTILRTTDGGKHWQKVNPPTQDDFRSVFAVDARQITVFLASASYQTTDGGATWTKLPPE